MDQDDPDGFERNARNMINIRRNYVLQDGLAKISRASFIPNRLLSVRFSDDVGQSEGAVHCTGVPSFGYSRIVSFFHVFWGTRKTSFGAKLQR